MKQPPHPVHWNYQHHPGRRRVLREESTRILLELRQKTIDAADLIADTREAHRRLFSRLVPRSCPNFAGHYRGENFPYLKFCSVGIIGNPFVGCPPQLVSLELQKFDQIAQSAIKRLDGVFASPNATMSSASKLLALVQVVARLFGHFLA